MDHKEIIIQAATELIEERGEQISDITVREISKRAHVGLGLINYHFGNKDNLIAICVEQVINGIVENFQSIREKTGGYTPVEKLEYLGNLTCQKFQSFLTWHRQRKTIIPAGHTVPICLSWQPAARTGTKRCCSAGLFA